MYVFVCVESMKFIIYKWRPLQVCDIGKSNICSVDINAKTFKWFLKIAVKFSIKQSIILSKSNYGSIPERFS